MAAVTLALAARFLIEVPWLLPSPVGDPAYFLTASVNYCRTGFLGTTAFPIDPTGQARMIWHGFVSPMLFSLLNPNCSATVFYLVLWLIKALTSAAILALARRRGHSLLSTCGLAGFALIAQSVTGFRPETLGLLFIVAAELAVEFDLPVLFGTAIGTLLCTQPTVAGLYGLVFMIARFKWLWERKWRVGLSGTSAVTLLLMWYPYSPADLIAGIGLQAKLLLGRDEGGLLWYYVLNSLLPLWGALLLAAWWLAFAKNRLFIALVPVLWFFGPRLPPTYYNLVPICFALMLLACVWSSRRAANVLAAFSLLVAVSGLALLTARDLLTIATYGDTFEHTRVSIERLAVGGANFGPLPYFVALTNPALRITDPGAPTRPGLTGGGAVSAYAVNGRPTSPCGGAGPPVSLKIGSLKVFNTNSGWMIYVCRGSG